MSSALRAPAGRRDVPGATYRGRVDTDRRTDPRVARTRQHVLAVARELLVEQGPAAFTFSTLAARAEVARKTLYRYWPAPEDLMADLIIDRSPEDVAPARDVAEVLRDYLRGMRAALEDRATSAAYGFLMMTSATSPVAAGALREVVDYRRARINRRLAPLGRALGEERFYRLNGPLVSAHYVGRRPISDDLVEDVVRSLSGDLVTCDGSVR